MRRLAQPQVVKSAVIAAALSAALCLPRVWLWENRPFPVWYIEARAFLGGFVLWAFVFAWHQHYTRRPVFTLKIKPAIGGAATLAGVLTAIGFHFFLDPTLRQITPDDYPTDLQHWIASTLFALAFVQLLLLFAPFAWLIRLIHNETVAMWLTVAFGVAVWVFKIHSSPTPLPAPLFIELLGLRIVLGIFAVWFYLRGGIVLLWWMGLLAEARHLFTFHN